jgi:GTPase SAR1 family protein
MTKIFKQYLMPFYLLVGDKIETCLDKIIQKAKQQVQVSIKLVVLGILLQVYTNNCFNLLFQGHGGAGKTALVHYLKHKQHKDIPSTVGIDISQWRYSNSMQLFNI